MCNGSAQRQLGPGYPEYIYHRAMVIEFKLQNVPFADEYEIKIYYKGEYIGLRRVDFLVEKIISCRNKINNRIE